jgi:serine/threonine-protein kinase
VLQQVPYSSQFGSAQLSFSSNGTLVLRSSGIDAGRLGIQWLDASGKMQPLLSKTDRLYTYPRLSPDGQRLAMVDADSANGGVWIYDLARDTMTRLTSGGSNLSDPVWTPDGQYVVYSGSGGIGWARADGGSKPQLLTQSKLEQNPKSFTPDGKHLAFSQTGQRFDLWTMPVERDGNGLVAGKPEPFLQSPDNEMDPIFSSDGRWIAYSSDESGRFEVYVRAFPDKGLRWQVSDAGGTTPMFSKNGRELFFSGALDDRIMVADYSLKGDSFVAEKPRAWSETRLPQIGTLRGQFDVTQDGKRVAALTYREGSAQQASGHVVFFQNFVDELRRKVPVGK